MNKAFRKRMCVILAMLLLMALLLPGCAPKEVTLRVLLEDDYEFQYNEWLKPFNEQVKIVARQFDRAHENVKVVIEQLPQDPKAREIMLERLGTEIMAGKGPDIFVLPAARTNMNLAEPTASLGVPLPSENYEMLFSDVELSMHNGLFADISEYYDADTELGKESLVTAVMDAGVLGDARYVLPLKYNIPLVYVDTDRMTEAGVSLDIFDQDIVSMMDDITESGLDWLAAGAHLNQIWYYVLNFFPEVVDYEEQEAVLTKEELTAFMRSYVSMRQLQGSKRSGDGISSFEGYVSELYHTDSVAGGNDKYGLVTADLDVALPSVLIAKDAGTNLAMYPLRATDGSVIADVTFYGAVGAGCEKPELAYELLRGMLSEEVQWNSNLEDKDQVFFGGLSTLIIPASGWPVRAYGGVETICRTHVKLGGKTSRMGGLSISDDDLPFLDIEIDKCRFSTPQEESLGRKIKGLYSKINPDVDDVKLEATAEEWLRELEWHLAEG